jgi:hypothetical protein
MISDYIPVIVNILDNGFLVWVSDFIRDRVADLCKEVPAAWLELQNYRSRRKVTLT